MKSAGSGGRVRYEGEIPPRDDELNGTIETQVMIDWLSAIGGSELVELIYRVFAKDLETESLPDLRTRIIDNLDGLKYEASNKASLDHENEV